MDLPSITGRLADEMADIDFGPPAAWVYNPLEYARNPHFEFLERFGAGQKDLLLVGMNPGPWGMAQTGIPFGAVSAVRDWIGISERTVGSPEHQHPKRPVLGFECRREEVSGTRLWGWAESLWGTPERFFSQAWVANYCPLLFLDRAGRNLTPNRLAAEDRELLIAPCDRALREIAETLQPRWMIGIGVFAEARLRQACDGLPGKIGRILHPSPASPAANRGWARQATRQLGDLGFELPRAGG
ncbi:MAG: uracil-DNA glycosylase family protein [Acidobacteriota bacterium]|nr:uracil-DNA glycosylase family protein [Acidobacteriota bacterium]